MLTQTGTSGPWRCDLGSRTGGKVCWAQMLTLGTAQGALALFLALRVVGYVGLTKGTDGCGASPSPGLRAGLRHHGEQSLLIC